MNFMIWNISEYDGISDVILGSDQFWTPNLVLVNNANKLQRLGDSWQPIRFTHEGDASFFPGDVFSATCRTDVTLYPLDSHWCGFTFTPWAHSSSEIYLHPLIDKVQKQFFSENGAWQFLDSNVARTGNADISFYIRLERRPLFVLVNIIMPVIFMTFLNAMVFCIPAKSGERMCYSITVLLAIAVFLTIVGENMPKTSTPMSNFSYYLLVILIISACITLTTIFVLHVFHFEKTEPVTGWWLKIAKLPSCRKNTKGKRYKRNKNGTITTIDECPPTSSTYFHSSTSVYDVGSLSRNEVVNVSTTYNDNVYLQCLQRQNE
ncbi:acetylcholine receptor subunit beta-type acr-3-like [Mercenaria mercenaria]|uniref:acetylcholine receptor subunit beta-type acr-3-like n=1 Tax=Mercenaria mercenaria TaxID=6596 RepID=UPI00234E3803|nr:acetylcholine receptor subunit beta-type acr-3-like [Mercenaria mercenaria]